MSPRDVSGTVSRLQTSEVLYLRYSASGVSRCLDGKSGAKQCFHPPTQHATACDGLNTSWKTWDRAFCWVHTEGWGGKTLDFTLSLSGLEFPHRSIICNSSLRKYSAYCQKSIRIHYRGTYFQNFPKRVRAPRVSREGSHNLMCTILYQIHQCEQPSQGALEASTLLGNFSLPPDKK